MRRRRRHRADFLNQIEAVIQTVRESLNGEADLWLWKHNEDSFKEKFSSHHTWNQIRVIHQSCDCDWHKGVWFPFSTPKYAFMAWLAFQDRLATGDKIRSWNAGSQCDCVFCGEDLETHNHLFFSCSFSSHVWSVLTRGLLRERYTTSWSSIVPILLDVTQPKLFIFTLRYVFQISLHSIWRERNGRRHGDAPIPAAKLAQLIDKHVRNRFSTIRETGKFEEGLRFGSTPVISNTLVDVVF